MSEIQKNKKILVVEDEGIVAKDIENTLKKLGYVVAGIASTGEEAISKAGQTSPDLILMDIRLAGKIDGITAAEAIRKDHDIPFIYLTAYSDEKTLQRAKITEPFGYLLKPFEDKELHISIETAFYRHMMERETRYLKEYNEKIVENIPIGLIVIDSERRITGVNSAQEALFGVPRSELIGRTLFMNYLKAMSDSLNPLIEKTIEKGKTSCLLGVEYANLLSKKRRLLDVFVSPVLSGVKVSSAIISFRDNTREKNLMERINYLEDREIDLTEKYRKVLYAAVKYPDLSDVEASKKIGINRSTYTGIRNKLLRNEYYQLVRVPNIPLLGFEMMTLRYGKLSGISGETIDDIIGEISDTPEYVYSTASSDELFSYAISENFTEYERVSHKIEEKYPTECSENGFKIVHFPFELSKITNVCDCSEPLKESLGLSELSEEAGEPFWNKASDTRLTENEIKVLYALTKYPDSTDNEIARKISLNKITVSQIKRRLFEENLIRSCAIPNLGKLGYNFLVLLHGTFAKSCGEDERNNAVSRALPKPITYAENMREFAGVYPFRDYIEYKTAFDEFLKVKVEGTLFKNDPLALIFPVAKILSIKNPDFAPLLKKKYGLEL